MMDFDFTFYRGRVALYACLEALGVGAGDEVAIQSFTCIAVPEAVMAISATPIYIDISANTVTMSPQDLAAKITSKTKAIVVQHTFGIPADMAPLMAIAEQHGIPVIEDCAHTLTGEYQGKAIGRFGVAAFYSFEWGKPVIAGIGGALVLNDEELKSKIGAAYHQYQPVAGGLKHKIQFLVHSILYRPSLYWPIKSLFHTLSKMGLLVGNYNPIDSNNVSADFTKRMTDFHYKKMTKGLARLSQDTAHSRAVAQSYDVNINNSEVARFVVPDDCQIVYARYPLIVQNKAVMLALAQKHKVELAAWYATPVHPLTEDEWSLVHYQGDCPNAEQMVSRIVSLPVNRKVTSNVLKKTIQFINKRHL